MLEKHLRMHQASFGLMMVWCDRIARNQAYLSSISALL